MWLHAAAKSQSGVIKEIKSKWPAMNELLQKYEDVFKEPQGLPPRRQHDHKIPIKPGAIPINCRPYKYASEKKIVIENMVQDMLQAGIIRNSSSPYASLVVLVTKNDKSWRMFIDYRALNHITIKDKFPILLIEEFLEELGRIKCVF